MGGVRAPGGWLMVGETPGRDMRRHPPDVSAGPRDQKLGAPTFIFFQDGGGEQRLTVLQGFHRCKDSQVADRLSSAPTILRRQVGDELCRSPCPRASFPVMIPAQNPFQALEIRRFARLAGGVHSSLPAWKIHVADGANRAISRSCKSEKQVRKHSRRNVCLASGTSVATSAVSPSSS